MVWACYACNGSHCLLRPEIMYKLIRQISWNTTVPLNVLSLVPMCPVPKQLQCVHLKLIFPMQMQKERGHERKGFAEKEQWRDRWKEGRGNGHVRLWLQWQWKVRLKREKVRSSGDLWPSSCWLPSSCFLRQIYIFPGNTRTGAYWRSSFLMMQIESYHNLLMIYFELSYYPQTMLITPSWQNSNLVWS